MGWGHMRTAGFAIACWLLSAPVWAQSDEDRAAARAAATQGLAEEEAGRCDQAIELFRRAESIIHAPPHLLHIARCEAKQGRLVSARETYLKVTREELADGAPHAFVEAHGDAQKELAALDPRVPSLKVIVEGGTGSVTLDGAPMPDALVGIDRPIDPGRHELRAKNASGESKPVTVVVAEGAHEVARLVLPAAKPGPVAGPAPLLDATEPGHDAAPPTERRSNTALRTGAYVGWGVGAAGVVFGTVMLIVNHGKRSDADALCPGGACPLSRKADIAALDSDASSAATMSWVGYGVGVVGLGVGTALFFLSKDKGSAEQAHAPITPWVGVGAAGVGGRF
jgi:hypothetical protein